MKNFEKCHAEQQQNFELKWGLNPQPLEPEARILTTELPLPTTFILCFLIYKYTKKLGIFNWSRDYIVDRKKVLKQAGVVNNIKSQ